MAAQIPKKKKKKKVWTNRVMNNLRLNLVNPNIIPTLKNKRTICKKYWILKSHISVYDKSTI